MRARDTTERMECEKVNFSKSVNSCLYLLHWKFCARNTLRQAYTQAVCQNRNVGIFFFTHRWYSEWHNAQPTSARCEYIRWMHLMATFQNCTNCNFSTKIYTINFHLPSPFYAATSNDGNFVRSLLWIDSNKMTWTFPVWTRWTVWCMHVECVCVCVWQLNGN